MSEFLKAYGQTEGPLGLPMQDRQAFQLEAILRALPAEDRRLRRAVKAAATSEVLPGERADVSWISTEALDLDREIVVARGMNDGNFKLNPLVTLQHCYWQPPVAKSLWRKRAKDGAVQGIKAKSVYYARPEDWPKDQDWGPDCAFSLVQAGMLSGKSIGFVALASHAPSTHEIAALPELAEVRRIIDEWLLLEYACCYLPCNPQALVEQVSKANIKVPEEWLKLWGADPSPVVVPPELRAEAPPALVHTTLAEVEKVIATRIAGLDVGKMTEEALRATLDRLRGRV